MTTTTPALGAPSPARKPTKRNSVIPKVRLVFLVLALVAVAAIAGLAIGRFFSTTAHTSDSQIYQSVERQEKVALLALGIQGISRTEADGSILGVSLPAGDRTTLIQYEFTAQVGIDGKHVRIDDAKVGANSFLISIPEFIFIGYDDPHFEDPIESNGLLSFVTEEIEETDMINSILSDEKQQTYIDDHEQILKDQARAYYTGIVASIDPEATVDFEFTQ